MTSCSPSNRHDASRSRRTHRLTTDTTFPSTRYLQPTLLIPLLSARYLSDIPLLNWIETTVAKHIKRHNGTSSPFSTPVEPIHLPPLIASQHGHVPVVSGAGVPGVHFVSGLHRARHTANNHGLAPTDTHCGSFKREVTTGWLPLALRRRCQSQQCHKTSTRQQNNQFSTNKHHQLVLYLHPLHSHLIERLHRLTSELFPACLLGRLRPHRVPPFDLAFLPRTLRQNGSCK